MAKPPRVGFVLEQTLGNVAYGMSLRGALERRSDLECVWLNVDDDRDGFGRVPVFGKMWPLRGGLRARHAIAKANADGGLDALFIHTPTISLLSRHYVKKIPCVLSMDATPKNYDEVAAAYRHEVRSDWTEGLKQRAYGAVLREARRFAAFSDWAKRSLVDDYRVPAECVTVIPPGTMLDRFPSERPPRRPGPVRILFVGGDFVRKGGDLLVEVFRRDLADTCELHLVTTSPDAQGGDGIVVHADIAPHSQALVDAYLDADVFVLPTRGDCFALVIGEAMAAGLPVVTTRVGGLGEAISDGETGFVIDVDDAAALSARLRLLAGDADLRARVGQRARRVAEEQLDMNKNADRLASILLELAGAVSQ